MKKIKTLILLAISVFFLHSCDNNKLKIDTSDINIDMNLYNLNEELFNLNTDSLWDEIYNLSEKYGTFWDLYTHQVIKIGGTHDKEIGNLLTSFITDPMIIESYEFCQTKFSDLEIYKTEIENAFKHYKYYFPEKSIPDIYTFIGGFNHSIVTDEKILAIGLDKYYGSDCSFYGQLQVPQYAKLLLDDKYIVNDCLQAWGYMEFEFSDSLDYLINSMIYEGKILYFINSMTPEMPDNHFIKYTELQEDWCKTNEKEMWQFLIESKLLFNTDYENIAKFTKDGPFTASFSQNSPGKAGSWIGFQIVKSYMLNNTDVTLQELMSEKDYQKILNFSKYNP